MFQSKSILVILLLAISQLSMAAVAPKAARHADAAVHYKTNAARMAAGLPPLTPQELQRRTYPGGWWQPPNNPWNPPSKPNTPTTPTNPNPPKPSQNKPDCDDKKEVKLKCKKKGGGNIGYVGKDWSKKGKKGFGLCTNNKDALKVDFENSVTPFDFKISKGKEGFDFLGFCGNNLQSGSSDSAVLTGTKKTNRGNAPSNVGNAFSSWSANSESSVWHYTRSTKAVEAKWVNSGGIQVATKYFYNPDDDLFHLVNDVTAFKKKFKNAYEVEFSIED